MRMKSPGEDFLPIRYITWLDMVYPYDICGLQCLDNLQVVFYLLL